MPFQISPDEGAPTIAAGLSQDVNATFHPGGGAVVPDFGTSAQIQVYATIQYGSIYCPYITFQNVPVVHL